jgi:PAS domain S-box-containing protein
MPLLPRGLTARISLLVLIALLSVSVVFGVASHLFLEGIVESSALSGFAALATAKQMALDYLLEDYQRVFRDHLLEPPLPDEIINGPPGSDPGSVRALLRRRCADFDEVVHFDVADSAGIVLLSLEESRQGTDLGCDQALAQGATEISVDMPFVEGRIFVRASSPLKDRDGRVQAIASAWFDAHRVLELIGDHTGLGETGESALGRRRGHAIEFLAPLRFAPDMLSLPSAVTSGGTALPMVQATGGRSGLIRALDYRDVRVVAAYRPLTSTGWGLVVKQDEEEVFRGAHQLLNAIILMLVTLVGFSFFLVVIPVVRRFTQPVVELAGATNRVAAGELDVTVAETGSAEVASLAKAFNHMVRHLGRAQAELRQSNLELDQRVEERTAELAAANQELQDEMAERRRAEAAVRDSEQRIRTLTENLPGVVYRRELEAPWRMRHISEGATVLTGYPPVVFLQDGRSWASLIPADDLSHVEEMVAQSVANHTPYEIEYRIQHADGSIRWVYEKGQAIYDNEPQWLDGVILDISDRRRTQERLAASLREKEVLLREIHHRVKNNMQVVISLLRLQSRSISDPQAQAVFTAGEDRIKAMALIHETLHQSENLAEISCRDYGQRLVGSLSRSFMGGSARLAADFCDELLHIDNAVPVGLIINELVTNAIQHAYPGEQGGEIRVAMRALDDQWLELVVSDDGIGLPADLDPMGSSPLGLRMVAGLAENQLGGTFEISRDAGTTYTIRFRRKDRQISPPPTQSTVDS